jgi:peptidoglycan hydrolase-like protein with peptidoglycan-binding domain
LDESLIADDFFSAVPAWQEAMMNALSTLQKGNKDTAGHPLDVHRVQVLVAGIGRWNQLGTVTAIPDTGTFDTATTAAVKRVQQFFGLTVDGIVGPASWSALVTGSA